MITHLTRRRGLLALLTAALLLVAGLTACDPPGTQTSDKYFSTVKAIPGLVDGEDAFVEVQTSSKARKPIYVEVTVDDGDPAPSRTQVFVLEEATEGPWGASSPFDDPEINTANPGGVDVYANVWNWDGNCECRVGAVLEQHNIQNLVFPSA